MAHGSAALTTGSFQKANPKRWAILYRIFYFPNFVRILPRRIEQKGRLEAGGTRSGDFAGGFFEQVVDRGKESLKVRKLEGRNVGSKAKK
jgi:hypothetical protein